ncbi:hypothetical protein G7Y89_g5376 [Cudoniella acicularis]|uniref:J domain-containing protein n=1 Tax=Cudoniella acicularis TaxID=354080 RepID=A0A8H4RMK8_9HELO|nr:hypothetical protein G7Y89_g5376 [Cudoniella acicularis]
MLTRGSHDSGITAIHLSRLEEAPTEIALGQNFYKQYIVEDLRFDKRKPESYLYRREYSQFLRGRQVYRRSKSYLTKEPKAATPYLLRIVDYLRLPYVESGFKHEDGSAFRKSGKALEVKSKRRYESKKESGEDLDKEVDELSRLLRDFRGKSDKNSSKDSGKKSNRESTKKSDKESGKKSDKESDKESNKKSDKESSRKSDKDSGKASDRDSNKKSDKKSSKNPIKDSKVTRVRKCPKKDYYAILSLEESYSGIEVKKAYKKLLLLTYPDKNKYKDAEKAFKRQPNPIALVSGKELIKPKQLLTAKPKKRLISGSEVKRRSKSRRHADLDNESDSDSDSDSSSIFVLAKKKGRRRVRDRPYTKDEEKFEDEEDEVYKV